MVVSMDAAHQMLYYAEPGITTSDSTTRLLDLTTHTAARWMHQSSSLSAPKTHNSKNCRLSVLPAGGSLKSTHSLQTIPEETLVQYQDLIQHSPDANQPLQAIKGDDSVGETKCKSQIEVPFIAAELPAMLVSDMADGQRLHETISSTAYPQEMSSPEPNNSSPSLQPMSISSSPRSMSVSQGESDMQSASALSSQSSSPNTDLSGPRRSSRRRVQRVELTGPYLVPHGYTTSPQSSGSQGTNSQRANGGGRRNGQMAESVRAARSRGRRRRIASSSDVSNHDDSSSTTGGTASVDSDLSCEVTIFTKGTSVLAGPTCPFCYKMLEGTEEQIYAHGNECLDQLDCKDDQQIGRSAGKMVSYVFEGVERVRAASLFEGSLSAEFGCGPAHMDEKNDEDVDVDQEDVEYGQAQYTDGDLIIPTTNDDPQCNTSHLRTLEDPQAEEEVMLAEEHVELSNQDSSENLIHGRTHPDMAMTNGAAQLVIDALKARIREQDKLLESVP
ncbi:hypothetical protein H4S08_004408, partial [Coemansia sp. RSA 1365]